MSLGFLRVFLYTLLGAWLLHFAMTPWIKSFIRIEEMRLPYGITLVFTVAVLNVLWTQVRKNIIKTLSGSLFIGVFCSFVALQVAKFFQTSSSIDMHKRFEQLGVLQIIAIELSITAIIAGWLLSIAVGLIAYRLQRRLE